MNNVAKKFENCYVDHAVAFIAFSTAVVAVSALTRAHRIRRARIGLQGAVGRRCAAPGAGASRLLAAGPNAFYR